MDTNNNVSSSKIWKGNKHVIFSLHKADQDKTHANYQRVLILTLRGYSVYYLSEVLRSVDIDPGVG